MKSDIEREGTPAVAVQRITRPLMVFRNLSVAAFDDAGQQIPQLQKSLTSLLAEHMEKCGYDPEGVVVETQWGRSWKLFKTELGTWNVLSQETPNL